MSTTKNIVPRTGSQGEIGTSAKPWDKAHIDEITASIGVSASHFYGDGSSLTGIATGTPTLDQVTTTGNTTSNNITVGEVSASYLSASSDIRVAGDSHFGSELADTHIFTGSFHQTGSGATSTFKDRIITTGSMAVHGLAGTSEVFGVTGTGEANIVTDGNITIQALANDLTLEADAGVLIESNAIGIRGGPVQFALAPSPQDVNIYGRLSASLGVTASSFVGDGSGITGVTAEWDGTHDGNAEITGTLALSPSGSIDTIVEFPPASGQYGTASIENYMEFRGQNGGLTGSTYTETFTTTAANPFAPDYYKKIVYIHSGSDDDANLRITTSDVSKEFRVRTGDPSFGGADFAIGSEFGFGANQLSFTGQGPMSLTGYNLNVQGNAGSALDERLITVVPSSYMSTTINKTLIGHSDELSGTLIAAIQTPETAYPGTPSLNGANLNFQTYNNEEGTQTRATITSSGSFGIGTTQPSDTLTVVGTHASMNLDFSGSITPVTNNSQQIVLTGSGIPNYTFIASTSSVGDFVDVQFAFEGAVYAQAIRDKINTNASSHFRASVVQRLGPAPFFQNVYSLVVHAASPGTSGNSYTVSSSLESSTPSVETNLAGGAEATVSVDGSMTVSSLTCSAISAPGYSGAVLYNNGGTIDKMTGTEWDDFSGTLRIPSGGLRINDDGNIEADGGLLTISAQDEVAITAPNAGYYVELSGAHSDKGVWVRSSMTTQDITASAIEGPNGGNFHISANTGPLNLNATGYAVITDTDLSVNGNLDTSGSSEFGNLSTDTHQFTGSMHLSGGFFAGTESPEENHQFIGTLLVDAAGTNNSEIIIDGPNPNWIMLKRGGTQVGKIATDGYNFTIYGGNSSGNAGIAAVHLYDNTQSKALTHFKPSSGISFPGTDSQVNISSSAKALRCDTDSGNNVFTVEDATTSFISGSGDLLTMDDTTAPPTPSNAAHLYAKSGEMYVMDTGGNETQISPHDEDGEWQYFSRNTRTGKVVRIRMEKMIRKLEELTGETFIEEE